MSDATPPASPEPTTLDEAKQRIAALVEERDQALAARDEARREAEATERRVVAALAGDLATLARRARSEHAERLGRGEGARFEHLVHHAKAFEFVAVELARRFGGEVLAAIAPEEMREGAPAPAATAPLVETLPPTQVPVEETSAPEAAAPEPPAESTSGIKRPGWLEID